MDCLQKFVFQAWVEPLLSLSLNIRNEVLFTCVFNLGIGHIISCNRAFLVLGGFINPGSKQWKNGCIGKRLITKVGVLRIKNDF